MKYKNPYALVLGGYVNGYSIVRELYECGVENIALFDYGSSLAKQSNKINYYDNFKKNNANFLKEALFKLHKKSDYIVIFPTDDLQLENLYEIYEDIKDFCFVPFNYDNVIQSLDKYVQYEFCEKYDIPYPKTINIETIEDLDSIKNMMFPILVKPNKLYPQLKFRGLLLRNNYDFNNKKEILEEELKKDKTLLASEFIPGDDTNMYSYNAYRNQEGKILGEWIGKKLTQFPNEFGMFSSASNEAPEIVKEQGKKLLEVMNLKGICEPEFKYDYRDKKYKLMEITFRSTMWNRLGYLSGVRINYILYLDALGENILRNTQIKDKKIHFIYIKHELINLICRKGYFKHFKHNVFEGDIRDFAVYNKEDIKPFLYDLKGLVKGAIGQCLRKIIKKF